MQFSATCEVCGAPAVAAGACSHPHADILISREYEKIERLGKWGRGLAYLAIVLAVASLVINLLW